MIFQVANHSHEAGLRELARRGDMPGWIRLSFAREPDFFQAVGVQGKRNQVLVALGDKGVVGMGCRSISPRYINGKARELGYLGGLRLDPDVRGTGALARGYAALRKLHDRDPVPLYLTTVVEQNEQARALLTSGRAGLPRYIAQGRYITYALCLRRTSRERPAAMDIRRGAEVGLDPILAFLRREGPRRQFFPVLEEGDFGSPHLMGLDVDDFRVAMDAGGRIQGVVAAWNQQAFNPCLVKGYAGPVRLLRPAIGLVLRAAGFPALPKPGEPMKMCHASFFCVQENRSDVALALMRQMAGDLQREGHHFLVAGFHERDPMTDVTKHFLAFRYVSRFYLVCWEDGLEAAGHLDADRIPYLDTAAL